MVKKDGLESEVFVFPLRKDSQGRYIPYCNLGWHPGIILSEGVCKARHCTHYQKVYVERFKPRVVKRDRRR